MEKCILITGACGGLGRAFVCECAKEKITLVLTGTSQKKLDALLEELKDWHGKSGLPLKKFFNTSGLLYKEMQLKDKLPTMSEEEQYELLATDGMLVKRPIIVNGDQILVGFKDRF